MRALATLVVVLAVILLLVLVFTRRAPLPPLVPSAATAPRENRTEFDAHVELLSSPGGAKNTERVANPSAQAAAKSASPSGPRCRVLGRIVDSEKVPLAGVSIRVYPIGGRWSDVSQIARVGPEGVQREELSTHTAGDGRFEFEAPLPTSDWVSLDVEPDVYHTLTYRWFGPAGGRNRPRLVEGDNDLGDMRVAWCGAAEGRVLSELGTPIAGVNVNIESVSPLFRTPSTMTDAAGHYVLGHMTPGEESIHISHPSCVEHDAIEAEIEFGKTTNVPDVVLTRAKTIRGIVVDEAGALVQGIDVGATSADRMFSTSRRTGPDGQFTIDARRPGKFVLAVPEQKGYRAWGGEDKATFDPDTSGIRIQLERAPAKTFHVVAVHTGESIERFGIRIEAKPKGGGVVYRDEADLPLDDHPDGELSLPFSGEPSTVLVVAPGRTDLVTDVANGAGTQTLALSPACKLSGRVMLDGKPLAAAALELQMDGVDPDHTLDFMPGAMGGGIQYDLGSYAGRKRAYVTGDDGKFASGDLAPGTYALQIEGHGAARLWLRGMTLKPEESRDLGDVEVFAAATVRGVLVAGADQSPIGFQVHLDHHDMRQVKIDAIDGKFSFAGLAAGHHTITWGRPTQDWYSDDDPHEQALDLAPGETRDVILDASASTPCTVIAHVQRGGKPAVGVIVSVRMRSRTKDRVSTERLGVTDDHGTAQGQVDGDKHFDLLATDTSYATLGELALDIDAIPGGRIERSGEITLGTLVLELGPALQPPESGELSVKLLDARAKPTFLLAQTPRNKLTYASKGRVWGGSRVEMGGVMAGTYDATVSITRYDKDANGRWTPVALREPYKTRVVIEADHEAKIVVP